MNIIFEQNASEIGKIIQQQFSGKKLFLVTDTGVKKHCLPLMGSYFKSLPTLVIPQGEENKTLKHCEKLWSFLLRHKADRHSLLLIIGGGMVSDLGGFCASVFMRGIHFVLIPTTLLAMVDASIGGKTGVDFHNGKNLIGSFSLPEAVICHPPFLLTLAENQWLSGWAEVVKHWLIADRPAWERFRRCEIATAPMQEIIAHSQGMKQKFAFEDFHESGIRKALNAGHTIGHAVESYFLAQKKPVEHGLAVAAGLLMESWIACQKGLLPENELLLLEEYIFSNFGALPLAFENAAEIWRRMAWDKKSKNGKVLAALVGPIGSVHLDISVSRKEWEGALGFYLGAD